MESQAMAEALDCSNFFSTLDTALTREQTGHGEKAP
jgi:hypothetical protein